MARFSKLPGALQNAACPSPFPDCLPLHTAEPRGAQGILRKADWSQKRLQQPGRLVAAEALVQASGLLLPSCAKTLLQGT